MRNMITGALLSLSVACETSVPHRNGNVRCEEYADLVRDYRNCMSQYCHSISVSDYQVMDENSENDTQCIESINEVQSLCAGIIEDIQKCNLDSYSSDNLDASFNASDAFIVPGLISFDTGVNFNFPLTDKGVEDDYSEDNDFDN